MVDNKGKSSAIVLGDVMEVLNKAPKASLTTLNNKFPDFMENVQVCNHPSSHANKGSLLGFAALCAATAFLQFTSAWSAFMIAGCVAVATTAAYTLSAMVRDTRQAREAFARSQKGYKKAMDMLHENQNLQKAVRDVVSDQYDDPESIRINGMDGSVFRVLPQPNASETLKKTIEDSQQSRVIETVSYEGLEMISELPQEAKEKIERRSPGFLRTVEDYNKLSRNPIRRAWDNMKQFLDGQSDSFFMEDSARNMLKKDPVLLKLVGDLIREHKYNGDPSYNMSADAIITREVPSPEKAGTETVFLDENWKPVTPQQQKTADGGAKETVVQPPAIVTETTYETNGKPKDVGTERVYFGSDWIKNAQQNTGDNKTVDPRVAGQAISSKRSM